MPASPLPSRHPDAIRQAEEVLRRGGVVLYPTETIYGLGCDPAQAEALERVRAVKGRDAAKPMLAVTDAWARVSDWLAEVPAPLRALMEHEPPLPATLVFEASDAAPAPLISPDGTVAIRRTTDPFAAALARAIGTAVLSTSANRAGQPPAHRFEDLDPSVVTAVDLALDAERPLAGVPSTVVAVRNGRLAVLREGAVDASTLERVANAA